MTGFIELTEVFREFDEDSLWRGKYAERPRVINVNLIESFYPVETESCPAKTRIEFVRHWDDVLVKESISDVLQNIREAVTDK